MLKRWLFRTLFFFILCVSTVNRKYVYYKILLITGFDLRTTGIGSDCSSDWATTTAFADKFLMVHPQPLFYFRLLYKQWTVNMFNLKFCWWQDLNCGPLVLEATALPTEPQPLPFKSTSCTFDRNFPSPLVRMKNLSPSFTSS